MDSMTEAREIDRRLNAATDPAEMRRLITARKLLRAGLELEFVVGQYERRTARPVLSRDSFPFRRG